MYLAAVSKVHIFTERQRKRQ